MIAAEFICYDRAGMTLVGATDHSHPLFDGTIEQQANAEMLLDVFYNTGVIPELKEWI